MTQGNRDGGFTPRRAGEDGPALPSAPVRNVGGKWKPLVAALPSTILFLGVAAGLVFADPVNHNVPDTVTITERVAAG